MLGKKLRKRKLRETVLLSLIASLLVSVLFLLYQLLRLESVSPQSDISLLHYSANQTELHENPRENSREGDSDKVGVGKIKVNKVLEDNEEKEALHKPLILMWSNYYEVKGDKLLNLTLMGRLWNPRCCKEAEITLDRSRLDEATAIVFFHYFGNLNKTDLPTKRRQEQLWVLFSKESPVHSPGLGQFDNVFNLTMSYRRDSDIWSPYGFTVERMKPLEYNEPIMIRNVTLDEWISNSKEKKYLALVASHCPTNSKREVAIRKIGNDSSIHVDIYGSCGKNVCPRSSDPKKGCDPSQVWDRLANEYLFYFAAENAFCTDYITEKFWRTLEIGMVPVVYGGGNYSLEAPPGSYIDSRDFKTPKELGNFLQKVAAEPGEYKKYFEWRRRYEIQKTDAWQGWCDLCKFVKDYSEKKVVGKDVMIQTKLGRWWSKTSDKSKGSCSKPLWKL